MLTMSRTISVLYLSRYLSYEDGSFVITTFKGISRCRLSGKKVHLLNACPGISYVGRLRFHVFKFNLILNTTEHVVIGEYIRMHS